MLQSELDELTLERLQWSIHRFFCAFFWLFWLDAALLFLENFFTLVSTKSPKTTLRSFVWNSSEHVSMVSTASVGCSPRKAGSGTGCRGQPTVKSTFKESPSSRSLYVNVL